MVCNFYVAFERKQSVDFEGSQPSMQGLKDLWIKIPKCAHYAAQRATNVYYDKSSEASQIIYWQELSS